MASFKSKEIVSILQKLDYIRKRQTGSHLMMFHPVLKTTIPVPIHNKDLKRGLLQRSWESHRKGWEKVLFNPSPSCSLKISSS